MADTTTVNLNYGSYRAANMSPGYSFRSLGFSFTHLAGDTLGFLVQAHPFWGTGMKIPGEQVLPLSLSGLKFFGVNSLLGLGIDLNFGSFGVLLGGGGFSAVSFLGAEDLSGLLTIAGFGFGGSALAYFHLSDALILNVAIGYGWTPWNYSFYPDQSPYYLEKFHTTNFTISAGIGWRSGNPSGQGSNQTSKEDW
ncbi:MAG: hypothetical protein MI717_05895 [Spirochaetales bacterium]|nr:hypothetical protein [Spirochaetales bacterium]